MPLAPVHGIEASPFGLRQRPLAVVYALRRQPPVMVNSTVFAGLGRGDQVMIAARPCVAWAASGSAAATVRSTTTPTAARSRRAPRAEHTRAFVLLIVFSPTLGATQEVFLP